MESKQGKEINERFIRSRLLDGLVHERPSIIFYYPDGRKDISLITMEYKVKNISDTRHNIYISWVTKEGDNFNELESITADEDLEANLKVDKFIVDKQINIEIYLKRRYSGAKRLIYTLNKDTLSQI